MHMQNYKLFLSLSNSWKNHLYLFPQKQGSHCGYYTGFQKVFFLSSVVSIITKDLSAYSSYYLLGCGLNYWCWFSLVALDRGNKLLMFFVDSAPICISLCTVQWNYCHSNNLPLVLMNKKDCEYCLKPDSLLLYTFTPALSCREWSVSETKGLFWGTSAWQLSKSSERY